MAERRDPPHKDLTAAIIIIGDEILKGHVQDSNSHFLCQGLWEIGVKVCRTVVVPDDLAAIATEVRALSPLHDFVLTSGGVGPTHDDITMEAVGRAFSEDIAPHPDILHFLFPGDPNDPAHLSNPWAKMAMVPTSTKVHVTKDRNGDAFSFLLMTVHNVHCYPGVPSLLKQLFARCKDLYRGSGSFYLKEVFFSCNEDVLAQPLCRLQGEYPSVQVGSYPVVSPVSSYSVRVALESKNRDMVEKAYASLVLSLPVSVMLNSRSSYSERDSDVVKHREFVMDALCLSAPKASLLPNALCSRIHDSLQILEKALEKYSLSRVCVAFNGGKDCTVILALMRALLRQKGYEATSKISILYIVESEQFPEVEQFVQQTVKHFGLDVIKITGGFKESLTQLKASHPEIRAICMGTRRTDPHSGNLETFAMTDKSWPEYMRVNCVLDWTYHDVWLFLRFCEIPYCKLYDQGYTSLDGVVDTHPNPSLLVGGPPSAPSPSGAKTYLPAYMLEDEALERVGRTSRSSNL